MNRCAVASLIMGMGLVFAWSAARAGDDEPKKSGKTLTLKDGKITVKDKLTDDDPKIKLVQESPSKSYEVKMKSGAKYTIDLESDDFDSVLILEDAKGKKVAANDDIEPGNLNSRIIYSPTADGAFRIVATCLDAKNGAFTLKVAEGKEKVLSVGKKGLTVNGTLTKDNKQMTYQVKLEGGKTYRIDAKSGAFDTYLFLHDGAGKKLAEDDDGGEGLNSRIIHKAAEDGTYRIIVSSFGGLGTGDFTLEVREEE